MVFRKSWVAYFWVLVGMAFWAGLAWLAFSNKASIARLMIVDMGLTSRTVRYAFIGLNVFFLLTILRLAMRLLWLKTFRIEVGDDQVVLRHGLLPWTKFTRAWDDDQIHECLFYSNGFFGWLTRSGDLEIVGREGSTHKYRMTSIGQVQRACEAVNKMRRRGRSRPVMTGT